LGWRAARVETAPQRSDELMMSARSLGAAVIAVMACGTAVSAQRQQVPPPGAGDQPNVKPAEIQRMFDAYALVQAQDRLQISEEQYPQFLARYKALQDVRRRSQVEHNRSIQDLNRLLSSREGQPAADDGQIRDRLKVL